MIFFKLRYILLFIILFLFYPLKANCSNFNNNTTNKAESSSKENFWSGLNLINEFGINILDGVGFEKKYKGKAKYLQGIGLEYSHIFSNKIFYCFNIDAHLVVKQWKTMDKVPFIVMKKIRCTFFPFINNKIGYQLNKKLVLYGELSYLWGLGMAARYKINNQFFIELRGLLWLDWVFNVSPIKGYDRFYFTFAIGSKLL